MGLQAEMCMAGWMALEDHQGKKAHCWWQEQSAEENLRKNDKIQTTPPVNKRTRHPFYDTTIYNDPTDLV